MSQKYTYKKIDDHLYNQISEVIKSIQNNIDPSNIGYSFSAKKKELEAGINSLFNLISKKETYFPSNGNFDEYDVDKINDISKWSKAKIEEMIKARGYGITTEDKRKILGDFFASNISDGADADEINTLKAMMTKNGINENELNFVKIQTLYHQ